MNTGRPDINQITLRYMRPAKFSLAYCSQAYANVNITTAIITATSYLSGLANLRPNHFPLIRLVFLNGVEESLTLTEHQQQMRDALDIRHTSSSANSA